MHYTVPLLITALFHEKAIAITLEASSTDVNDGESLLLTCTTPDFADNIIFKQDNVNRLFCFADSACPSVAPYPGQRSGTTQTILTLTFSKARDVGHWECSYGFNTSEIVSINEATTRPYTSMESTTEITTNLQTTTLEITSSTTKDIVTDDKITTTQIAELTTVQTMVTKTVTKPTWYGVNVDLLNIYYWCSVFAIGIFILAFYWFCVLYVKHQQSSKTVMHVPTSTENKADKKVSKPIESYSKAKRPVEYQNFRNKDSFQNTPYGHGKMSNRTHGLSGSQFQYEPSYIRSYPDRSLGNYRPQMSLDYVNKVYSPESAVKQFSKQHETYMHSENDFKFYRGSHSSNANKINVNKKFDNRSRRLELNQNCQPEFYY